MLNRLRLLGAVALLLPLGLGVGLLLGPAAGLAVNGAPGAALAQGEPRGSARDNAENRPPDFRLLQQKVTSRGPEVVGIFGGVADPAQSGLWRVKVWEELNDRVTISTDKIGCSVSSPLRITGTARRLIIRALNPGGVITPANRLDHLMWWAVCFPEQAGKDPAGLGPLARQLGYSGRLPEREEVVVGPGR
jgi:hypothetical protein